MLRINRDYQKVCLCGKGYMSRNDHLCGHCRTRKDKEALEKYCRTMPQRIVVFGGRDFTDIDRMEFVIRKLVEENFITDPCELVCGMARGADITAFRLFSELGIRIHEFPADWDRLGKRAGFVRNGEMAEFCTVGIGFWNGISHGTKHMIDTMDRAKKPCIVVRY
uniref:GTP-binding domain protein n=1 Tax=Erwinia phage Fifi051 TaxID=3238787 RepID=A0AB39ACL3_9CAUD